MRPMGEISRAMMDAAAERPGTVRELAARTQVGYDAARYTATRLVDRGQLVRVSDERPVVLALAPAGDELAATLQELHHSFWDDLPPVGRDDAEQFLAL